MLSTLFIFLPKLKHNHISLQELGSHQLNSKKIFLNFGHEPYLSNNIPQLLVDNARCLVGICIVIPNSQYISYETLEYVADLKLNVG
jgi:hypothetical protein